MREDLPDFIRRGFPGTWYHPKFKLLSWFPRGVLNEAFADQVVEFVETEERIQDAPFDRYADFSGLSQIRIGTDHIIQIAIRRHSVKQPVRTAILGDRPLTFCIALMYERLMEGSMIHVRAFEQRLSIAEWLDVPIKVLSNPLDNSTGPS
jgi:hypothetical protein